MEYLEGWEIVPGLDDAGGCGRDKPESPPVSPRLDTQIPTEKDEKEDENPTPIIFIPEAIEEEEEAVEIKDPVSPLSLKETEFVDMKPLESKSKSFDDEEEEEDGDQVTKDDSSESEDGNCGGGESGFDVWKWGWGLTGIGALMFVLVLGAAGGGGTGIGIQTKNHHIGGFKGYEDNQRLKEMVSAVRGGGSVPLTRAHITFGGYYDAPTLNH